MDQIKPFFGLSRLVFKLALPCVALGVVLLVLGHWVWAVIPVALLIFLFVCFRDPERKTPGIPNSLCSPADGKVTALREVPCDQMPQGRAFCLSIDTNLHHVHVQRAPITATVESVKHESRKSKSVTTWMKTGFGLVGVRQVAGAFAPRIICRAGVNSKLKQGDRYGYIPFGSSIELFLPLTATPKVTVGQQVTAGVSCVAVMEEDKVRKGKHKKESDDTSKKLVID